jgi:hypothetical protein
MRALIVKQSIATVSLSALCKLLRADHPFVLAKLRETVIARTGLRVSGGPFAGLKLSERSVGSELLPKLLGTYELELHRVIEEFLSTDYDVLINIGCGEGFYAWVSPCDGRTGRHEFSRSIQTRSRWRSRVTSP